MKAELEKWLDEHEYQPDHFLGTVVRLKDLRALFDGKVLVPVEATRQAWALTHITTPNEVKGRVMSEMFWRGVYACQQAMLAASQEQGK